MPTKAHPPKSSGKTPDIYARRIIATAHQHVEVLACPGSGKTATLIWRAQSLLDRGEPARQIAILSFGNAAVREIRHRMNFASTTGDARSSGRKLGKSTVATAHAFALSMFERRPSVMSEPQQLHLVSQAVRRAHKLANQHKLWPSADDAKFSRRRACLVELLAKAHRDSLLQLFDYVRARQIGVREALTLPMFASLPGNAVVIKAVIEQYSGLKRERRLIDFADMLEQATTRVLAGRIKLKVKHLLIDEFQDSSAAQTKFFAAIATYCGASIMAFGDPRQSIYGFAGASYQSLAAVLPDVKSLPLPRSWRLTHETAALASALDQGREHPPILAMRSGTRPVLCLSTSETQQARHVVADIQQLQRAGAAINDIVVLARNRATLRTVEAALLAAGIDSSNVGTKRSDRHVLNVLRIVWWASRVCRADGDPMTAELLRSLDTGGLAIGKAKAAKEARTLSHGPWGAKLEGRFVICAKAYLRLLGGVRENSDIAATINRWLPMTRSCTGPKQLRDTIRAHRSKPALQTSTIHSAKGLQWPHVLLVGVTEGVLPDYRALGERELDQERNVLFVGITRAMESLRMYHAPTVNPRSRRRHHMPSYPLTNAAKLGVYDVFARMHEN